MSMLYITEADLRAQFAGGAPESYAPPPGARLTPAARQYLQDLKLFCYAEPDRTEAPPEPARSTGPKPEQHTHLNAHALVRKDDARIALRGQIDLLEAEILVTQTACARLNRPEFIRPLQDALELARRVLGCEVTGAPLGAWTLNGMNSVQVRAASHDPRRYTGGGHVLPDAAQGELPALLNRLRACVRRVEVQAVATFGGKSDTPERCDRLDLIEALNRLSSYFYVLQLQAIYGEGT
ncbi:MAG: hypothetical protein VB067_06745 [Christensenellaceae bacterium]|nr:hypothetical protein [Christensenellaceae bacterium]MEA5066997.1 hypothetical protein [Eubacteriales bacterium]MEA5068666.1 hypothetical protein [Christensenellaceae bacterium]